MRTLLLCTALLGALAGCSSDPETRKREFFENGSRLLDEGKPRDAVIEFRNAVQIDPKFGTARAKLAEAYVRTGDMGSALGEYVRAADLLPDDLTFQLTAGAFLLQAGRMNDALARADVVLAKQPDHVEAHILRGNALAGLNDIEKALAETEEAIRLDPERGASYTQLGMIQLVQGRQEQAETAFVKAVSLAPDWVEGYLALGNYYWAARRFDKAETAFRKAIELNPTHIVANRMMAVFFISTDRVREAEAYLRRLAESSKTPAAVMGLADYYLATGRPEDAIARLTPLAEGVRPVPSAILRIARAYATKGDRKKAQEIVDDLIAKNPKDAEAGLLRAQLLIDSNRQDEALTAARAAAEAEPTSIRAQLFLGRMYASRGDLQGAEKAFREVLKQNPRAVSAQLELSAVQLSSNDAQGSLRSAETAVAMTPDSAEARLALVRSLLATNSLSRADNELRQLLEKKPDFAPARAQHGILLAARKQTAAARSEFERALALDPKSPEALAGIVGLDLVGRNPAAAIARLERRLGEPNPSADVLLLAARAYAASQTFDRTEQVLRQAIEKQPTLLPAYAMLGQLYVKQNRLEDALREYDALATKQSNPVGALTMAGILLQTLGNEAEARKRFERALTFDPRAAVSANNLAWIYVERNENLPQAVRLAEAAAEALPKVPEVQDTLGWAYYKSDLPVRAVAPLLRCVELQPSNAVCHQHLGMAYVKSGEANKGRESLERALKLKPDLPGAAEVRQLLAGLPPQS
jgi:putative PEP-CTERM system TPR-repeat lipoprotein